MTSGVGSTEPPGSGGGGVDAGGAGISGVGSTEPPGSGGGGVDAAGAGVQPERLHRILAFLEEADRLKSVERRTRVGERQENPAEHSWHMALYVLLLAGELEQPVDAGHAIELCIVHDLVEIRAGDTYAFDEAGKAEQHEREARAADELFGLLPDDLGGRLRALWDEFEAGETGEAKLAKAVDRMQALAQNLASEGAVWQENAIRAEQVRERNAETLAGDPALAALVESMLERAAPYLGPEEKGGAPAASERLLEAPATPHRAGDRLG